MTPTTRLPLVERLRQQATANDHERGCQGREYSCDCGYDSETYSLMQEAAALIEKQEAVIAALQSETDRLRATNRDLHRRAQAVESAIQMQLRETGYHEQKRLSEMWSASWKREFDRLVRGHQQVKEIYEVCAKVLNLPYGRYHSVMDSPLSGKSDGKLYANVFLPEGGAKSFEIVNTVKRLAILAAKTLGERE